eukprot:2758317-Rhodomonas_salina.1
MESSRRSARVALSTCLSSRSTSARSILVNTCRAHREHEGRLTALGRRDEGQVVMHGGDGSARCAPRARGAQGVGAPGARMIRVKECTGRKRRQVEGSVAGDGPAVNLACHGYGAPLRRGSSA